MKFFWQLFPRQYWCIKECFPRICCEWVYFFHLFVSIFQCGWLKYGWWIINWVNRKHIVSMSITPVFINSKSVTFFVFFFFSKFIFILFFQYIKIGKSERMLIKKHKERRKVYIWRVDVLYLRSNLWILNTIKRELALRISSLMSNWKFYGKTYFFWPCPVLFFLLFFSHPFELRNDWRCDSWNIYWGRIDKDFP